MKIKQLAVGNLLVKNNVFLAPMAGYTDYGFRALQIKQGVGLTFTELVSAKGLNYGAKGTEQLLFCGGDEKNTVAQIFGGDPYHMRLACESEYLAPFEMVDINMGCPVPKVYKNGEGSALLGDIKRAEQIVSECVKSKKIITVKIRTGLNEGDNVATEFAKMAEGAGASLITIHGRVRTAYYSGEPDYDAIYNAKKAVGIPVIANGGIFDEKDADKMMDRTGADGIMLARGAIANPFLVCTLTGSTPTYTKKEYMLKHIRLMEKIYGDKRASLEFRKFIPYYLKGAVGVKREKLALMQAQCVEEIIEIIEKSL